MKILVINPGSTSTKLAVYDGNTNVWNTNISHPAEELSCFQHVNDQYDFRKKLIIKTLKENGIGMSFSAVIGRGGLLKPT